MRIERGKPFAAETVGVDTYQMIPVPNLAVGLWSVSANDRLSGEMRWWNEEAEMCPVERLF